MVLSHRPPDTDRRPARRLGFLLVVAFALPGCATGNGPLSLWRMGNDASLSKGPTKEELGDDRNLVQRWLSPRPAPNVDPTAKTPLVMGPNGLQPTKIGDNPEAEREFKRIEAMGKEGKLTECESALAALAKNRKGTYWGEKAQYHLAELQLQRGKLVAAHDSYERLIADYPGTLYRDQLVKREWEIAQRWLAIYDPTGKTDQPMTWSDRFTGARPLLDTNGHALQVLEHVRHHDPTGPLADDAVLQIADFHMKTHDYESAAIYYDQLVTDHPKSPFVQRAQRSAIDARIKGYIGPEYDAAGLQKAREQIKTTMAMFPDRQTNNAELYHKLDLINDQDAERTYVIGDYYRRAGYVGSAEFYFAKIPRRWPESPWAVKAKTQLAALAKMPRKKAQPNRLFAQPGMTDPFNGGSMMSPMGMGGPMGNMGAMGGGMGAPGGMF